MLNLKRFYDAANAAEARVQTIASQINDLFEQDKTEDALKLRPELDKAKAEAKDASQLYLSMLAATRGDGQDPARKFVPAGGDPEPKAVQDLRATNEYVQEFIQALRVGASPKSIKAGNHRAESFTRLMNALTETGGSPAGEEGGFLTPVDFDNRVKELQRQFFDMSSICNVEVVNAFSGWRAIEQATALLPFAEMTENVDMAEAEEPLFSKIDYTLKDYGGYIPVSNDLLADTPIAILTYLARWMAKKSILTRNALCLAICNALTPVPVTDSDDLFEAIKTALNTTLDPDISASATICTNQSGFNMLDQLQDGTGRPLMQPDPTSQTQFRVKGRMVHVLADRLWPNLDTPDRARFCIGDCTQLITHFRRQALEIATTNIGGSAWRRNNTEARGIMREVAKLVDAEAATLLVVTLPS